MPNYGNVDERVVEMRIDNRQFVDGAEKTIGILDRLKSALSFKDTEKDLYDLNRAADRVDFSGMANGIDTIADRFSVMGIVGMRVIQNLTDSVTNYMLSTAKALSIGQISAGFAKYESLLTSTQTIMAATRNERNWGSEREQLDYVNEQLEKLSWFTDETSFNFTDMANSIGKFTSAGVPLDRALEDMEGIATWAGISGATYNEASRAMYNLSQAMAMGSVRLMDWRSIENANMGTVEFKQTVLDTAVALGQLEKTADGTYQTLDKKTEVTATNFAETLQKGWFTSEVLEGSLKKYGEFATALRESQEAIGDGYITTSELIDKTDQFLNDELDFNEWHSELVESMGDSAPTIEALRKEMEKLSSEEYDLGRRAFAASQMYKTFADVISATKDAVSSGFMRSLQLIIGDAEEAKEVWTAVGEEFWSIFAEGATRRNEILESWRDLGGRDSLLSAFASLYQGIRSYIDPIREAFADIFSWGDADEAGEKLKKITDRFKEFADKVKLSDEAVDGLKNIFTKFFTAVKAGTGVLGTVLHALGSFVGFMKSALEALLSSFDEDGFNSDKFVSNFTNLFSTVDERVAPILTGLLGLFTSVAGLLSKIKIDFSGFGNFVVSVWNLIASGLSWVFGFITKLVDQVKTAFSENNLGANGILKIAAGIMVLYKAFMKGRDIKWAIEELIQPLKFLSESIVDAFYAMEKSFSRTDLVRQLLTFAFALGILAVSLVLLASVDIDRLSGAFGILTAAMVELVGALEGMRFLSTLMKKKSIGNVTKGLLSLAASMLIFSIALKILSSADPEALSAALGIFFILLIEILAFMEAIKLLEINSSSIKGIISLAIAMLIFSGVIYILGSIPFEKLAQGLIALGVALFIIVLAAAALSNLGGGKMLAAGASLILVAVAITILTVALAALSFIPLDKLFNGILAMGLALGVLALALVAMQGLGTGALVLLGVSVALIIAAAAFLVFAVSMQIIQNLPLVDIADGLIMVGISLISLAVGLAAMTVGVIGAVALVAAAAGLFLLSSVPLNTIADGLMMVGVSLLSLAIGLAAMTFGIVGAIALAITAGSLLALAAALAVMQGTSLAKVAGGLILLAPALVLMGIAGVVFLLGVPGLIAGSLAITLLGAALVPFAYGLKMLGEVDFFAIVGFFILMAGAAIGLGAITPILTPLAIAIGVFGAACLAAGAGIALVGVGFEKVVNSINAIPDGAASSFKELAQIVLLAIPEIVENGEKLVGEFKTIADNVVLAMDKSSEATTFGRNFILGYMNGITSMESALYAKMAGTGATAAAMFANSQGIHSPSSVARSYGQFWDEGYALGIYDGLGSIESANDSVTIKMVEGMQTALAKTSAIAKDGYDLSPKITPVVDLSSAGRAGARLSGIVSGAGLMDSSIDVTRSQAIDVSASFNNAQRDEGIKTITALMGQMVKAMENPQDLYLNDRVLAGRINRRLGKL